MWNGWFVDGHLFKTFYNPFYRLFWMHVCAVSVLLLLYRPSKKLWNNDAIKIITGCDLNYIYSGKNLIYMPSLKKQFQLFKILSGLIWNKFCGKHMWLEMCTMWFKNCGFNVNSLHDANFKKLLRAITENEESCGNLNLPFHILHFYRSVCHLSC